MLNHFRPTGNSQHRAFTFIELLAIIGVLAVVGLLATMNFQNVTRAGLRKSARELSNSISYFHHLAVARNLLLRMVIDLKTGQYWLERGTPIRLAPSVEEIKADDPNKPADVKAQGKEIDIPYEERRRREEAERKAETGDIQAGLSLRYTFEKMKGSIKTEYSLSRGLRFRGVQTEHDEEMISEGTPVIYFFPTGQTERSLIYIEQEGSQTVRTIVTQPLTGRAFVFNSFIEWDHADELKETL